MEVITRSEGHAPSDPFSSWKTLSPPRLHKASPQPGYSKGVSGAWPIVGPACSRREVEMQTVHQFLTLIQEVTMVIFMLVKLSEQMRRPTA